MALTRLKREFQDIKRDAPCGCTAGPIKEDDMFNWEAMIFGPEDSPYAGGIFKLAITYPSEYPFKPPSIVFRTKVYHPNISETGIICLDILKEKWAPSLTISKVLLSIMSLLTDPNPSSALNGDAGRLYDRDREAYNNTARSWVAACARDGDV